MMCPYMEWWVQNNVNTSLSKVRLSLSHWPPKVKKIRHVYKITSMRPVQDDPNEQNLQDMSKPKVSIYKKNKGNAQTNSST